jgi:pimeloyl-ACP methyl ester carboxylesterase
MGHKPFLVLADALTRKGILVLRYDKRGVGKSTGNYAQATTADFADDAEAGLRYLETRPEANPHRIGFIGHSEGGVIAPIVAARNRDVAFIVLLAGTGVPGAELLLAQHRLVALAAGVPPAEVERQSAMEKEILELVEHTPDNAAVERQIHDRIAGKDDDLAVVPLLSHL